MTDQTSAFRFTMSGQAFTFDADPERLMGDEVILIEDVTGGPVLAWTQRIERAEVSGRDLLLLAFLAKHRENPLLEWPHFVKTVAPFTLALAADEQADPPKPRASRARTATSS